MTKTLPDYCYIERHAAGCWSVGRYLPSGEMVHFIEKTVITDALARVVYEAAMAAWQPDIFVKSLLECDSDEIRFERLLPRVTGGRRVTFCFIKLFFEALHPERQCGVGHVARDAVSVGV